MMNGAPTVRRPISRATSKNTSCPWCHMSSTVVEPPRSRSIMPSAVTARSSAGVSSFAAIAVSGSRML